MLSPSDTSYPRLAQSPSKEELDRAFTPNVFELRFVEERARESLPRLGLLVLLKTFQRLGYFIRLGEVPAPILHHIAGTAGVVPTDLAVLDASTVRFRHMSLVRSWVGVTAFDRNAHRAMVSEQALATLTPYQTEHINRFGNYMLDLNRTPEPITTEFRKPPTPEKPSLSPPAKTSVH